MPGRCITVGRHPNGARLAQKADAPTLKAWRPAKPPLHLPL
jgi:hypothetical protein